MIAMLRGTLVRVSEEGVILEANGVGYAVTCAPSTLERLPPVGGPALLHTELVMREDGITLYGFLEEADRFWFRLLQTIQGVGARVALAILGAFRPPELSTVLAAGDTKALTRTPGVGPRLAARIVAELQGRLGARPANDPRPGRGGGGAAAGEPTARLDTPAEDALSALVNLGYGRADAFAAVLRARGRLGEATPTEALIREALGELAR